MNGIRSAYHYFLDLTFIVALTVVASRHGVIRNSLEEIMLAYREARARNECLCQLGATYSVMSPCEMLKHATEEQAAAQ